MSKSLFFPVKSFLGNFYRHFTGHTGLGENVCADVAVIFCRRRNWQNWQTPTCHENRFAWMEIRLAILVSPISHKHKHEPSGPCCGDIKTDFGAVVMRGYQRDRKYRVLIIYRNLWSLFSLAHFMTLTMFLFFLSTQHLNALYMSIDLVFVLKWVKRVTGWALYVFHLSVGDWWS